MNWKKLGLTLLYPHIAIIICLMPISISFLVFALIYLGAESIIAICSYLLAFYILLVICFRMPKIIKWFINFKKTNKFINKWFTDIHLRVKISLYASLIWNISFAIFQLWLGFYNKSFWFYSVFAYYIMLSIIRFFLVKHTRTYSTNQETTIELKKTILCGWLLLLMNLSLAVIVFFMVYWNKTYTHNEITTIAMAAYTFTSFIIAIINLIKYKKYSSPIYSSAKILSLISASVSILTLETTMLTTFGNENDQLFRQIVISVTGFAVIGFAIALAIIMIIKGTKLLNKDKEEY